jgi:hypothetical protein
MAFREAIGAKAFDLLEDPVRKLRIVAPPNHPADQPLPINAHALGMFEGRHGTAQLVRLVGREARGDS